MEQQELELLEGTVSAVIFQNEENGYTILKLDVHDEEVLARILEIEVGTDILLEVAMTIIFIWSSWIVRGWAGVGIYLGAYVVYLLLKRKDIAGTFRIVKETFRPSATAE